MTAEFAVVLPVLVVLVAMVMAAGAAGVAKLRCIDAARSAARLAARHEPPAAVLAMARSVAPDGAVVGLTAGGELVRVHVTAQVRLPLPGRPVVGVDAGAVALVEEPGDLYGSAVGVA